MKAFLKRLIKVIGFFPILFLVFPIELLFYLIRWFITGKEFTNSPILLWFIIEW